MRRFVRTVISIATLVLSAAAVLAAHHDTCSLADVAGTAGYTITGTVLVPTGAVPFAAVGTGTLDANGNYSAMQTSNTGGIISKDTLKGTVTLNPDCTCALTVGIYDQSGHLLRTSTWACVFVDDGKESRAVITSMVLPNGTSVPVVMTAIAKLVALPPGKSR